MKRALIGLSVFALVLTPGVLLAAVEGGVQTSPAAVLGGDTLVNTTEAHLSRKVAQLERLLNNVDRKLDRLEDKVERYHR